MLSPARTQRPARRECIVSASILLTALIATPACTSADNGSPTATTESSAAPESRSAEAPAGRSQQSGDTKSLVQQKQQLLLSTALDNAKAMREAGDLEGARIQLEQALQIDPSNADATVQYLEVQELLGERPGDLGTTRKNAEDWANVRNQGMKLEAEEFFRVGQEAAARRDYDAAIRCFERVEGSIKWSSLNVDWGDLPNRNETALAQARRDREEKLKTDRETKLKTAVTQIKDDEAREQERHLQRIKNLLESANYKYDAGDYDESIQLCDEVLALEPSNAIAKELKASATSARRSARTADFDRDRQEAFRRFKNDIEELRIPFSDGLTPPSPEYWDKVTRRTATGSIGGDDAANAEDNRIREQLKAIIIPVVNFTDEEITAVCTYLSNWSGIPILVTTTVRSELESGGNLVTLTNLTNLSVDSILTILTKSLGDGTKYAWTVRNSTVQITTVEEAYGATVIRTHAIQDLTFGRTDFKGPDLSKISLPGAYGDDAETSVFAADLDKVVTITPEDLVALIRDNVAKETWDLGDKKFNIDVAASNQILVIHTPQVQAEIEAFLNDLRRFTSTVVQIESRFVEITDAFIQEVGADFRGLGGVFGTSANLDDTTALGEDNASQGLDNLGTGASGTAPPSSGIFFNDNSDGDIRGRTENFFESPLGSILSTSGGGSFQFSVLDDTQFNLVVRMVEKSANATEIMAPELTVFNTERAYVSVLNEVSFLQDFDVDVANTAFIANPEVGILQEGVVLDVRPTISYDRKYVTLDVRTTVATLERPIPEFETTLGGFSDSVTFQLPRLEVQNANTTVVVPDGGSVILGGLKTVNYVNRRAEVPWVSRIPIIGVLFRDKGLADEVKSLVILVKTNIRDMTPFREATPIR